MKGDDDGLEEVDVLFSQGDSETTDNTSQNIQKFSSTVEFVVFVDESVEAISDGLSNHFSSGDELGIESVKDILEIFSFSGFFRIEKLQKLLNKSVCNKDFQRFNINGVVHDKLKEKFIDRLYIFISGYFLRNTCKWGHEGSTITSSSSIPGSEGAPLFLITGRGLKIFFSIISITWSRWGIMRLATMVWSLRSSESSER